jgi:hypothetical protein
MPPAIERKPLAPPDGRKKVQPHFCCAPCSGEVSEAVQACGIDFTIFLYNPNTPALKEYELRENENIRFAEKFGIPFVDADSATVITGSSVPRAWRTSRRTVCNG